MCNYTPRPLGKEPPVEGWEHLPVYRHSFEGVVIRTHRTHRVSPAGWVWAVILSDKQVAQGYAATQRAALNEAAHRMSGPCGYTPKHRSDGCSSKALTPTEYAGRHSSGDLPRWAREEVPA